MLVPNNSVMTV